MISPCLCGLKDSDATYFECSEELIEIDCAALVAIKVGDQGIDLLLVQMDVKVFQSPHELVLVQLSVSIIVEDAEDASDAANGHSAALLKRSLDIGDHLFTVVAGCGLNWLRILGVFCKHNIPEVLRVNRLVLALTDSLTVVLTGEHLSLVLGRGSHA